MKNFIQGIQVIGTHPSTKKELNKKQANIVLLLDSEELLQCSYENFVNFVVETQREFHNLSICNFSSALFFLLPDFTAG